MYKLTGYIDRFIINLIYFCFFLCAILDIFICFYKNKAGFRGISNERVGRDKYYKKYST